MQRWMMLKLDVKSICEGSTTAGRNIKRSLQPRKIYNERAEPLMSRQRQYHARRSPEQNVRGISPGYGAQHALKEKCGTREIRLRSRCRDEVARISRRRSRAPRSGSPRGS